MDRLTAIGLFVEVVQRKSFSAAARHAGIGVSTVSKHVAQLEAWLGAKLFHRTTRRVTLTDVGEAFYQRCTRIVAELREAETTASQLHGTPQGLLRVNAPLTFGVLHVVPAVREYLGLYREVTVDLTLDDRSLDPIEGGFDVTIRIAHLGDSSLIGRKLAPNRLVVCGSPAYLERHGVPKAPQDLVQHRCLTYTNLASPGIWRFGPRGETSVVVSGPMRANSGDALREAAILGLGLAQLPLFIASPALEAGALRAVLEDQPSVESSIYALLSPGRVSAKVRTFVDFLAERFGPRPCWERARQGSLHRSDR
jgi:DNA-binding transcriptional LysR family regulator